MPQIARVTGRLCAPVTRRLNALCRTVRSFATDRRGNTALIFGLAVVPIVGAVAAAIDYSRANAARTSMQAVLDATTL